MAEKKSSMKKSKKFSDYMSPAEVKKLLDMTDESKLGAQAVKKKKKKTGK